MFNRRLVDRDIEDWVLENWRLLHAEFGPQKALGLTEAVLPKPGVFGMAGATAEETGLRIFEQVRHYSGLGNWPVELEPFTPLKQEQVSEYHFVNPGEDAPAGLFIAGDGSTPIIRYDITLTERPTELIATFAHELAHYLLLSSPIEDARDPDIGELLTDLTAVYTGFGVFLANSAFEFEAHQGYNGSGWRWRRQGYLSENTLVFATALFAMTSGTDAYEIAKYLKPKLAKVWPKALKQLAKRADDIAAIRQADAAFIEAMAPSGS